MKLRLSDIKPERAMFFGGILLIGIGAGLHDLGLGIASVGVVALLSLKPLLGWLR